ncbi:hypothetical protein REPUB_Repub04eG0201400 [Reevesia pubescens]
MTLKLLRRKSWYKWVKEAFKEDEHVGNAVQSLENASNSGDRGKSRNKHARLESSGLENASTSIVSTNGCPSDPDLDGAAMEKKNVLKKQKRRKASNHLVDNTYIKKVQELAKIKQKQDEDKATSGLHSLNKISDCAIPSSDKIERMKSLRSLNSCGKLKSADTAEHIPVLYPEVVLCVEVYHNIRKWSKIQEFLALGHQTLTELKDKIYCLTDQVMHKAGQHDPSGYFLIEVTNPIRSPFCLCDETFFVNYSI